MPSPLQRLTAWLCLVAALLTGFTPARDFVVCLEPDGCVSVELANSVADCGGCDGHGGTEAPSLGSIEAGCPCVDLQLPGSSRAPRLLPKPIQPQLVCIAILPAPRVVAESPLDLRLPRPVAAVPRPPDSLARIRSVVLLL